MVSDRRLISCRTLMQKRAGGVLVQRQGLALLIDGGLRGFGAAQALGPGEFFLEQHHRAEDDAQGLEEKAYKKFHGRF
jgi:hypothetical protein